MATLPRDAKVEIDAVAIVGHVVDVEDWKNNASRIVGVLPMLLMLVQCFTIYRFLAS